MARIPKMRHHKGRNLAAVVLEDGRYRYLGPWGSEEAQAKYDALITEWLANGRRAPDEPGADANGFTITELCVRYFEFASGYYVKNGRQTGEVANIKLALRQLRKLYGHEAASEFGPKKLAAVRLAWVREKHSRGHINKQVARIKRAFDWAIAEEFIPGGVGHALRALKGLRRGRSAGGGPGEILVPKERPRVLPVSEADVTKTVAHLSRTVAGMVQVQALLGCRPEEVCAMRMMDLDRSETPWLYRPEFHKNSHHDQDLAYPIGPRCQEILRGFFKADPKAHLFSPIEAERERLEELRRKRKTKVQPSQRSRKKASPKRQPKEHYTTDSYRRAIHRACDLAGIERWSPNRLRHSRGTQIRQHFGLEAAQVALGHSKADVTQVYAERNLDLARRVAEELG